MLKLIDVEKLEEDKADCCVPLTQWQEGWNAAIDVIIGEAPTVEAIPVKWLEDYQIKEFIKADPSSVEFQRACGIGCAIEAWRKENEMR